MASTTATADRRVPGWAAPILTRLFQDQPPVVTRDDMVALVDELELPRPADSVVRELRRIGWLQPLRTKGVWAVLRPGEAAPADPYIELRAWQAVHEDATFALAGEHAAWHLGYLNRAPIGKIRVWVPQRTELPKGLRQVASVVRVAWSAEVVELLAPRFELLRKRGLDVVSWSSGLLAFGPEALLVQLANRPTSFTNWADLVEHLAQLVSDIDYATLTRLLAGQSTQTWQRLAYLLDAGGDERAAARLITELPGEFKAIVYFGARGPDAVWIPQFHVLDRVVAPLLGIVGKA